ARGGQRRLLLPYRARPRLEPPLRDCGERGGADDPDPRRAPLRTLSFSRSRFIASVTIARTVSERFFFVFSHSTCSGVSHTLTRSVFRSAIAPPRGSDLQFAVSYYDDWRHAQIRNCKMQI